MMKKNYTDYQNKLYKPIIIMEFHLDQDEVDLLVDLSKQDINKRENLILYVDGIFYRFIDIINYIQSVPRIYKHQSCKLELEIYEE